MSHAMWLASWSSESPSALSERGMTPARVIADDEEGRAAIAALHVQRGDIVRGEQHDRIMTDSLANKRAFA